MIDHEPFPAFVRDANVGTLGVSVGYESWNNEISLQRTKQCISNVWVDGIRTYEIRDFFFKTITCILNVLYTANAQRMYCRWLYIKRTN